MGLEGTMSSSKRIPGTYEDAVEVLLSELSDKDRAVLRGMSRTELVGPHFGLGLSVRNRWLWNSDGELLRSCAERGGGVGVERAMMHPDTASALIVEAVWERLQGEGKGEEAAGGGL